MWLMTRSKTITSERHSAHKDQRTTIGRGWKVSAEILSSPVTWWPDGGDSVFSVVLVLFYFYYSNNNDNNNNNKNNNSNISNGSVQVEEKKLPLQNDRACRYGSSAGGWFACRCNDRHLSPNPQAMTAKKAAHDVHKHLFPFDAVFSALSSDENEFKCKQCWWSSWAHRVTGSSQTQMRLESNRMRWDYPKSEEEEKIMGRWWAARGARLNFSMIS